MADDPLDRLSTAVADGVAVDWDRVRELASSPDDRAMIQQLRVIAAVSTVHRTGDIGAAPVTPRPTETIEPPPAAARWGPLVVLGDLAEGSFGRVYHALDPRLEREVALKVLRAPDTAVSQGQIVSEARLLARVRHENVVSVYGADVVNGEIGLWMELIHGHRLDALVASDGPFGAHEAALIGTSLCRALAAVHHAGLLHRDIKAQNVMREAGGRIVLMDFGAGRELCDEAAHPVGTPIYLAPEVLRGGPASVQSDIYSLGVLLFFLTSGRYPAVAATLDELRGLHDGGGLTQLRDVRPELPSTFVDAVMRAVAADPNARYESAGEFEHALRRTIAPETIDPSAPASATKKTTRRRRHAALGASILMVAAIAAAAGVIRWPPTAPAAPPVLAVLPPANPTGDPAAEQLGTATASLVLENFRKLSGVKLVSREATAGYGSTRTDLTPLGRAVGASYVLDLTVRNAKPPVEVVARLRRPDAGAPLWEKVLTGDVVVVEKTLLDELANALAREGIRLRSATGPRAPARLPTVRGDALMEYVEARALLDYNEVAGNTKRAVDRLEQAILEDGQFALAHAALADALRVRSAAERDSKLLGRAAVESRKALQLDPEASAAHSAFAAVEYASGRRDTAVTSLQRALDLQPDNDEAHRLLGQIVADQGRVDDGLAHVRTAIRMRPTAFIHYHTLGFILVTTSQYAAAVEAYRKAADLRPQHPVPYQMLGATYHMMGDLDQAIGNYEHAVRIGPTATAYSNLALVYFTAGIYDKALTSVAAAIERDPKKASLQRDLGDIYTKLGRRGPAHAAYERAIAMARETLAINAQDPFSIVLIALCETGLGRRTDAERHATEAMALAPQNRDVLFRSAKVFAATGNHAAALRALRGAVERGYNRQLALRDPQLSPLKSSPASEKELRTVLGVH